MLDDDIRRIAAAEKPLQVFGRLAITETIDAVVVVMKWFIRHFDAAKTESQQQTRRPLVMRQHARKQLIKRKSIDGKPEHSARTRSRVSLTHKRFAYPEEEAPYLVVDLYQGDDASETAHAVRDGEGVVA